MLSKIWTGDARVFLGLLVRLQTRDGMNARPRRQREGLVASWVKKHKLPCMRVLYITET
jgi:hypothetical protein